MRELYSFIFETLTDPFGLPLSPLWEYIIMAVIGVIAFKIAWEVSPGGQWGSEIHWTVRLLAMVIIWAIVHGIIEAARLVMAHWAPVVCVLSIIAVAGIIIAIVIRQQRRQYHTSI